MTISHILSRYEHRTLTRGQLVCGGTATALCLGWWVSIFPLPALVVGGIALLLCAVRLHGDLALDLFVRAFRFHIRSRFTAVECAVEGDRFVITSRDRQISQLWRSDHRGRLDLRNEEKPQWTHFLRQIESTSEGDRVGPFSFHIRGSDTLVATKDIELASPWVHENECGVIHPPRWIFESWRDVQSPDYFYRTFEIRHFRQAAENLVDAMSDRNGRWSLHAHFFPLHRRVSLRRSRRDRHAADAAMSWRGSRGASSPATLTTLRLSRHHHEERVALGASLIDFRMSVVVRAVSRQELEDVCGELQLRAERYGISLHAPQGDQARAFIASWPGAPE